MGGRDQDRWHRSTVGAADLPIGRPRRSPRSITIGCYHTGGWARFATSTSTFRQQAATSRNESKPERLILSISLPRYAQKRTRSCRAPTFVVSSGRIRPSTATHELLKARRGGAIANSRLPICPTLRIHTKWPIYCTKLLRDAVGGRLLAVASARSTRELLLAGLAGSVTAGPVRRIAIEPERLALDQPQPLEARVSLLADDDVVVHGNSQRPRDLHDRLRHLDVGVRRRRVAGGVVVQQSTLQVTTMISFVFCLHGP
jgi:hypothetical protein